MYATYPAVRLASPLGGRPFWRCLKVVCLAVATSAAVQLGAGAANASIVYMIDRTVTSTVPTGNAETDTVLGVITTNGAVGTISSSDILGYDLNLIDDLNASDDFELTPANSTILEVQGSALSATATSLFFDFSGNGEFLIQADTPGPFSGYRYVCFSTGGYACSAGEAIAPQDVFADGAIATGAAVAVGNVALGRSPASVPEPVALSAFAIGLAAVGFARWRRTS